MLPFGSTAFKITQVFVAGNAASRYKRHSLVFPGRAVVCCGRARFDTQVLYLVVVC